MFVPEDSPGRTRLEPQAQGKLVAYFAAALLLFSVLGFLHYSGMESQGAYRLAVFAVIALSGLAFLALDSFGFLCMTLAMMPLTEGAFKFEIGVITFSPYTMGAIVLGLKGVVLLLLGRARYRLERFDIALGALCAFFMATLLFSPNPLSGGFLAFHALFIPTLSYFTLRVFITTRERLDTAFSFFAWGIALFSLATLVMYAFTLQRVRLLHVPAVSIATLAVAPALVILFSERGRALSNKLMAYLGLLTVAATFSRMYILGILLSPLLAAWIRRGRAMAVYVVMMVGSLAISVGVAMSVPEEYAASAYLYAQRVGIDQEYRAQESTALRVTDLSHWRKTIEMRALYYRQGMENFFLHPVAGVGLFQGKVRVTQHNFHIEWLEFGGVVGYILFFLFFASYAGRLASPARNDGFLAGNMLVVLIILVNCLTNGFMHGFFPYVTFIAMGFSFAQLSLLEGERPAAARAVAKDAG